MEEKTCGSQQQNPFSYFSGLWMFFFPLPISTISVSSFFGNTHSLRSRNTRHASIQRAVFLYSVFDTNDAFHQASRFICLTSGYSGTPSWYLHRARNSLQTKDPSQQIGARSRPQTFVSFSSIRGSTFHRQQQLIRRDGIDERNRYVKPASISFHLV